MAKNKNENYLDKIPSRPETIGWKTDENSIVTLEIENKGVFNFLAQKLLKKPKISYIHLDELGSFVWTVMDGERNIAELAEEVKAKFGDAANPLYERLAKYFQILDSYGFVKWNEE